MTAPDKLARGLTESPNAILEELSNLQQWCVMMTRKDSGGLPAADLIQRTRILIIELRAHIERTERHG